VSYLFDTDTLSNPQKKRPSVALLRRLASVPAEEQFTTTITVGEMVYGAHRSTRTQHFLEQLDTMVWPKVRSVRRNCEPVCASRSTGMGRNGCTGCCAAWISPPPNAYIRTMCPR
jgi:hypothetical protein